MTLRNRNLTTQDLKEASGTGATVHGVVGNDIFKDAVLEVGCRSPRTLHELQQDTST